MLFSPRHCITRRISSCMGQNKLGDINYKTFAFNADNYKDASFVKKQVLSFKYRPILNIIILTIVINPWQKSRVEKFAFVPQATCICVWGL